MTDDVSRETPPAPSAARGVFGNRLPLAQQYADLLVHDATVRGLIGPREVPRIWERHLLNCAVVSDLIHEGASVVDIGSGAGLPGICLAIRRPDLQVTLVEPLLRRTTFLNEAIAALGLSNVVVHRGRAEDLHGRETYDVVTSRAVAPLPKLLRWSLPLCGPEGQILAMKGSTAAQEIQDSSSELRANKVATAIEVVGAESLEEPVTVIRVRRERS